MTSIAAQDAASESSLSRPAKDPGSPQQLTLRKMFYLESKTEFLKSIRMPAFAVPTIAFPILFYVFFGIIFGGRAAGPVSMAGYLLATYGAFGVIGASLFAFGVGVAVERGQGWLLLKRASPMPPSAYLVAKLLMATIFSSAIVAGLYTLGATLGHVRLEPSQWLLMALVHVAGALPFSAFGLALGYWCGPNSAPAVVNLIYLPMGFLSGLWIPLPVLPEMVQKIAVALPAYHFAQLALAVLGADSGDPVLAHIAYLSVFTAFCLWLAQIGYRRDEDKTYG